MEEEETLYWTNPEAGEVGIGGIKGLVVSLHQTGDDTGLLLVQTWPHRLPCGLLLFPLYYHVLLPLNLLVGQDDCERRWDGEDIEKHLTHSSNSQVLMTRKAPKN